MIARNAPAFPPPGGPAALYRGDVMHARMKPKAHRFTYGVYTLLIDIDALDAADRASRFFSVGRRNLLSFEPRDHGDGGRTPLREHIRRLLAEAGLQTPPARILLLCYPRVLGFVFNPISVYFAYDADGQLIGVVYEVRNTFGDMHTYVAPVRDGELTEAGLRQERDKLFHVSPFMDMAMRYGSACGRRAPMCAAHSRNGRRRADLVGELHRKAYGIDEWRRPGRILQHSAADVEGRRRNTL